MINIQKLASRFTLSISFIAFCLFILTFGQFSPIEIKQDGLSFILYFAILIGLPIVAIKELRRWFAKMKNQRIASGLKILVICILPLYILYALVCSFGNTMCGNIIDETLFIKKDITSSRIVVRHYDCGATDSGPAKYEVVKIVDIISAFNLVTRVDTTTIDKTIWIRANRSR